MKKSVKQYVIQKEVHHFSWEEIMAKMMEGQDCDNMTFEYEFANPGVDITATESIEMTK